MNEDNISVEVISIDPIAPIPSVIPGQMYGAYAFAPGIFPTKEDSDSFLDSLDSDTRDYVIKHTDDFRSKEDIMECVQRLHGEG
ncbi:MAG: hypothetical protein E7255_02270 [Lachnospiraceae bacterium]|jgi:hypothetical protein|nr:hypothetical protein [Lachnospiraceae bacterium]